MDTARHPYREFEITIKGLVGPEYGGSGDFGWSDLAIETEVETTLGSVVGTPPNVEGALDLYGELQDDSAVIEMISEKIVRDLPPAIKKALLQRGENG